MIVYVKTFNEVFRIDDGKLLEKYKTIQTKIEDLQNIELNALQIYDDINTKIKTYGDKNYTNFRGLNVPDDGVQCEFFTIISIEYLLFYKEKFGLQVYLDNFT